jgi:outer membrane receptor for Fe3+-dicitrate
LAYTLGWITRNDGEQTYSPHFDRRHNLNFVGSYTFGKNLNWEVNARWNLGSGFPFTKTQGFYHRTDFSDGINTDYTTQNTQNPNNLGIIYGPLNQGRLPTYHRLDLSLKREFALTVESTLETTLSITNVYNRKNIFYFDRIRHTRVNQLPIMPSIGVSLKY